MHVRFEVCTFNCFGGISILQPLTYYLCQGHVGLAMPPFAQFLSGPARTVPRNRHIKYEMHCFNHFGAINIQHSADYYYLGWRQSEELCLDCTS